MIGVFRVWRMREVHVGWGAGEAGEERRRVGQGMTGG